MRILFALVLAGLLAGCSTTGKVQPEIKDAVERYAFTRAVTEGVDRIIDDNPERKQKALNIVNDTRKVLKTSATVTLDSLEEKLREEISWESLEAPEQQLANDIIKSIRARLDVDMGVGLLKADDRVRIDRVLDLIELAAQ